MKCPIDGTPLVIAERSGVEIYYCPSCRGVWLDRGELDKIIDRSVGQAAPAPQPQAAYKKKKRGGGFLEELFDLDLALGTTVSPWKFTNFPASHQF